MKSRGTNCLNDTGFGLDATGMYTRGQESVYVPELQLNHASS